VVLSSFRLTPRAVLRSRVLRIPFEGFLISAPGTPTLPVLPYGLRPDTDIIEVAPCLPHDHSLQSHTMDADTPLHHTRDEPEGDVPLDLRRSPGHQDHPCVPGVGFFSFTVSSLAVPAPVLASSGEVRVRVFPVCCAWISGDPVVDGSWGFFVMSDHR